MTKPHGESATKETSGNPLFPGLGVCDPHVRIFNDRAYLYATHDKAPDNPRFTMEDWWIWSSDDLITWKHEMTLKPCDTHLGADFKDCWATDAIEKYGTYFWYLSKGPLATTVVTSDSPVGPWKDTLGKSIISNEDTKGAAHDPSVLIDDNGTAYMVVGAWDYHIAKLNDDMISLAEPSRIIQIENQEGPVGPGRTDDKPTLHKRNGIYYLSWGCYYAMSDNVYGPYVCKGSFIQEENLAPEFRYSNKEIFFDKSSELFCSIFEYLKMENRHSTFDRHGSFFEWRGQWYFHLQRHEPDRDPLLP